MGKPDRVTFNNGTARARISSKVRSFVNDVYVALEWKPDPPGELEWTDEKNEEDEGFGAVEFTVTTEQRDEDGNIPKARRVLH